MLLVTNFSFLNKTDGDINVTFMPRPGFVNPFSQSHIRILFIIVYSLVFACCFFGNIVVLFVIVLNKRMRTRTNFFLANLAVADFCVGIFCILPNLSTFLSAKWILGRAMCKIYYFVQNMSYTSSILLLVVIAVERYFAIMHPLRSRRLFTVVRLQIALVCIWLVASGYNIPMIIIFDLFSPVISGDVSHYCFTTISTIEMRTYYTTNFVIWYIIPLSIMAVVYTRISLTLWATTKNASIQSREMETYQNGGEMQPQRGNCACFKMTDSRSSEYDEKEVSKITNNTAINDVSASCGNLVEKAVKFSVQNCNSTSDRRSSSPKQDHRKSPAKVRYCIPSNESSPYQRNNIQKTAFENSSLSPWQVRRARNAPKLRDSPRGSAVDLNAELCSEVTFSESNDSIRSRLSVRRPRSHRMNSRKVLASRRRVIRLLMAVLLTFAACVLPNHLRLLLQYWQLFPRAHNSLLPPISFVMLYLNSALNPVLYWLFSDSFRRSFQDTFFCRRKSNIARRYTVT